MNSVSDKDCNKDKFIFLENTLNIDIIHLGIAQSVVYCSGCLLTDQLKIQFSHILVARLKVCR